ncbi:DUF3139 domain-containing protein [Paenibacillus sp. M1]|uniref:DUF3139 domain-containing protein n=1 Tax=Paenibacillus haidiansis TaxID=1574488 RepID=A0ABU7VQ07_9BACL
MGIIAALVTILVATPIIYVQANKQIYANRVTDYLVEEQNYNKDDLKSVKGVWGVKLPSFFVTVTFKDEPNVEYIYFAHNEVIQFSYRPAQGDNDIEEAELKHFDPFE